jgi:hypothetical protein
VSVIAEACSSLDDRDERVALDYLERIAGARIHSVAEALPSPAAA